jgi:hypothetical protein
MIYKTQVVSTPHSGAHLVEKYLKLHFGDSLTTGFGKVSDEFLLARSFDLKKNDRVVKNSNLRYLLCVRSPVQCVYSQLMSVRKRAKNEGKLESFKKHWRSLFWRKVVVWKRFVRHWLDEPKRPRLRHSVVYNDWFSDTATTLYEAIRFVSTERPDSADMTAIVEANPPQEYSVLTSDSPYWKESVFDSVEFFCEEEMTELVLPSYKTDA